MKKILKNILLVGNDPLAHVSVAFLFTMVFGWWGLIPSFFFHFPIDAIPHGHVKSYLAELAKGEIVAAALFFWIVFHQNFPLAICFAANCVAAIIYDVVSEVATYCDKKKVWEKFSGFLADIVFCFVVITIQINSVTHWMGNDEKFRKYQWPEPEKFNSLPDEKHFCLRVSWLNIGQLIWSVVILFITFKI